MKTCRNLLAAAFVAVSVTGCIPPLTTLKVATTETGATPAASVSINAGQQAVLSWTGATLMPYSTGLGIMYSRDYKITPSDAYAAAITIGETCGVGLSSDWTCLKTKRSGTFAVTPYVSGTYTLTADEDVKGVIPDADRAIFSAKPVKVTVTVNQDVLISDVLPQVTDARLKTCITRLNLTRVNEVTNLACVGSTAQGEGFITSLAGLEYFYALQSLDISNNLLNLDAVHAQAPRYMAFPTSVNLYRSGLNCTNQKAIEAALLAKNPSVFVNKGTSTTNLCP